MAMSDAKKKIPVTGSSQPNCDIKVIQDIITLVKEISNRKL